MITLGEPDGLHGGREAVISGAPIAEASAAVVLLHGRGSSARDMLSLAPYIQSPDVVFVAPEAANHTWYPHSFLQPLSANQPWLSSALTGLAGLLSQLATLGIAAERTVLVGFSQGGCLSLEFAARNPTRYGGVIGLSAGLIGPPGTSWPKNDSLDSTPVFLGCSDRDPHIPLERVRESERVLADMGGEVTVRIYENFGHTINEDELAFARDLIRKVAGSA